MHVNKTNLPLTSYKTQSHKSQHSLTLAKVNLAAINHTQLTFPSYEMEVKVGHCQIKEFHFHIYWFQQNCKVEREALAFKEALIEQVKQQNFIVVCEGIDEKILPALKSPVPKVNRTPRGPHPCGSFEVFCTTYSLSSSSGFL